MSRVSLPQPVSALTNLLKQERDMNKRPNSSSHWWKDTFSIRGSAITRVYGAVAWITLWSCVVAVASIQYNHNWGLTNSVVPLLSVVVGLLLVFRNSTAFSRWEDGRKTFNAQASMIRNASRYLWTNIGMANYDPDRVDTQGNKCPYQHPNWTEADQREKIAALRMLIAVIVSTKRHVRHEFGTDWEDLRGLLPANFNDSVNRNDYGSFSDVACRSESPANIKPSTGEASATRLEEQLVLVENEWARPSLPLPLVILHHLQRYFAKIRAKGYMDHIGPSGYNTLHQMLSAMTDEIGTVERLNQTPIPAVYGIHLKQCVTLYLFLLPLCLVGDMSWKMVGFVTSFAFILVGIEGIAAEIEKPFGYDGSDLPLDFLCAEVRNEVEHIIAHVPERPTDF